MTDLISQLRRLQRGCLLLGAAFLVLAAIGWAMSPRDFMVSYLPAFIFWFGLSVGCLNVAMIYFLTGGRWGAVTRRIFEAGFMTLPIMAIFFIPICIGRIHLYPWARPTEVAADKILQHKSLYENSPAFIGRAVVLLIVWLLIAACLRRWSAQSDGPLGPIYNAKLRALSGLGIVLVPLTVTFALIDWVMSIEASWFSTIFPVVLLAGEILAAFALAIVLLAGLRSFPPFAANVTPKHFRDLGNLLLAFIMFWTYVAFSQFLIIYSGNLPHEIEWYLHRIVGGWKWVVGLIALFHFLLPFFLLLFRAVKQKPERLAILAAILFLVHMVAIFWTIIPTFSPAGVSLRWADFVVWPGLGAIWLTTFFRQLVSQPLLLLSDPHLEPPAAEAANAK